jgi:hypothetical protein
VCRAGDQQHQVCHQLGACQRRRRTRIIAKTRDVFFQDCIERARLLPQQEITVDAVRTGRVEPGADWNVGEYASHAIASNTTRSGMFANGGGSGEQACLEKSAKNSRVLSKMSRGTKRALLRHKS